ncbi:hypothetical protein V6N11_001380 [Hibiscus sabdariffa]|uniref:Uncharacterized protein n=1 Tax=Hibiscus sabdariffa TaxID=183260 RepID=A0ABR2RZT5_9ROSI
MVASVWLDDRNVQLEATIQFQDLLSLVDSSPIKEAIQFGVVPRFVEFLARDDFQQLQFEAAWVITNISVESTVVVIYHGAVPLLVKLLESPRDDIREQTRPALSVLKRLICSSDEDVLSDACWALSDLSDGTNDKIQAVIEAGSSIPSSPQSCSSHRWKYCYGDDMQTQAVIDDGIIAPLVYLLRSSELEIGKEIAWAISNATFSTSIEQKEFLVGEGCLILCDLLLCSDPRIVIICLEALENILKAGEAWKKFGHSREANLYSLLIDDVGGLEKIEILHGHGNKKIYEMAVKLHETYWVGDELLPPDDAL